MILRDVAILLTLLATAPTLVGCDEIDPLDKFTGVWYRKLYLQETDCQKVSPDEAPSVEISLDDHDKFDTGKQGLELVFKNEPNLVYPTRPGYYEPDYDVLLVWETEPTYFNSEKKQLRMGVFEFTRSLEYYPTDDVCHGPSPDPS